MSKEQEQINKRIFYWMNPDGCWHERRKARNDGMVQYSESPLCFKCGKHWQDWEPVPSYFDENAPRKLLDEVIEKAVEEFGNRTVGEAFTDAVFKNDVPYQHNLTPHHICMAVNELIEERSYERN